jgi:signal transduction histidine kinase
MEGNDLPKAIQLLEESIELFHNQAYYEKEMEALIYLGRLYRKRGNANISLRKLNSALQILSTKFQDDKRNLALIYKEMGVVYADNIFDFPQALEYCFKALSLDIPELIVPLYNNIGSIYRDVKDYKNAIFYLEKGMEVATEQKQLEFSCYLLENLGSVYVSKRQFKDALPFYLKGLEISTKEKEINFSANFIYILLLKSIGQCHLELGNMEEAGSYLKKALTQSESKGFQHLHTEVNLYLADYYLKNKNTSLFKSTIDNGISLCMQNDFGKLKIEFLEKLQHFHEQENEYKEAFNISKQIQLENSQRSSLYDDENLTRILENRESEIFRLEEKNMQINRQKEELEQFAYIVTHDLKGPLINIGNYGELIDAKYSQNFDKVGHDFVNFIIKDSKRLQLMLDDLLQYIRVDQNDDQKLLANPNKILDEVQNSIRDKISNSNAAIKYESFPMIPMREVHLQIILRNLISNAIKFRRTDVKPVIEISFEESAEKYTFCVSDNGIGIDQEFNDQIFQIFKRLDNINFEGTGIGLSMCKKIIGFYNGEIWVESSLGNGSKFYFDMKKA